MRCCSKSICSIYTFLFSIVAVIATVSQAHAEDFFPLDKKPFLLALAKPDTAYPPNTVGYSLLFSAGRFHSDPALYREPKKGEREQIEIMQSWSDYVYKRLQEIYTIPREDRSDYCVGPECPAASLDPATGQKPVRRVVMKETLKFIRGHMPWIDEIIESLRLEISENPTKDDPDPVFKDMNRITALTNKQEEYAKRLTVRTQLRLRAEEGSLGFIAETNAGYRNISSYFRVDVRKLNDTTFGIKYILAKNTHLVFEHETKYLASFNSSRNPVAYFTSQQRISQNALRLMYFF